METRSARTQQNAKMKNKKVTCEFCNIEMEYKGMSERTFKKYYRCPKCWHYKVK